MANSEEQEPRRTFRFTFGLERLGLIPLMAPRVALLVIVALAVLAAVGVSRIQVDDSLSELFRTDSEEFRQYEEIDRRFPSSEFDVLVVAEGPDLLKPDQLRAFGDLTTDLQLIDGVSGLVSMLSARDKPDETGYPPPIVPDEIPQGAVYDAMIEALRTNDIVKGKFLSDDGQLALIVIALDRTSVRERSMRTVIGEINDTVDQDLGGTGLTAKLTGAPVMQLEIRNAVERDRLVYNGLGFVVGIGIAYLFFRRISLTAIAVLGPAIAILWTLGMIGAMDFRLNLFINVITPLILVSGFSNSMHLVMSIRRDVLAGVDRFVAARHAVLDVAPACLLTAMNAALAILSFQFANSALIRTFGTAALMAVGISYIAVAVVVPTLAVLFVREEKALAVDPHVREAGNVGTLQRVTDTIVGTVAKRPMGFFVAAIIVVILTGAAYVQLKPHYRLADQVPDKEQALAATSRLDAKLTGANPMHAMISWKGDQSLYDPATLSLIAQAHTIMEERAGLGNVWSLDSLRRWLAATGDNSIETVKRYIGVLPTHLVRRFIAEDEKSVLVTARLPDVDASEILPVVELLDDAFEPLRKANPGYKISVTGLPAIAARNSAQIIWELNWGFVGDMFVIFIFLGIALRSALVGFASIMPSLFPIFATGAVLWLTGGGLQFASIVAITVAFSLAINSTIHFLNRFTLEEDRVGGGAANLYEVMMRTAHYIGPPVVLTTIVLALGLGVTMLSYLPSLRLFGQLAAVCLFASLIAQLVILPAVLMVGRRLLPRDREARKDAASPDALNT